MGRPTVSTTEKVDGVTRTTTSSQWTPEDQALLLAWREYQDSLCPDCGNPKATAWHPDNEDAGFEVTEEITCWGCTAKQPQGDDGRRKPVTFPVVVDTRDYEKYPLPVAPST